MLLAEFLTTAKLSYTAAAAKIRGYLEKHDPALARRLRFRPEMVRRYCLPEDHKWHRKPAARIMPAIVAISDGKVTPNDIYGVNGAGAAPDPVRSRLHRRAVRAAARKKAWATRKARARGR